MEDLGSPHSFGISGEKNISACLEIHEDLITLIFTYRLFFALVLKVQFNMEVQSSRKIFGKHIDQYS